MSQFTGPLTITHLDADWRRWRLEEPLFYAVGSEDGPAIEVPQGFVTDGASVPRPLWNVLPAWGRYSRAAVVHDYLCAMLGADRPLALAPTYRRADAIFYEAMKVCGVGRITRAVMWAAVRAWTSFK